MLLVMHRVGLEGIRGPSRSIPNFSWTRKQSNVIFEPRGEENEKGFINHKNVLGGKMNDKLIKIDDILNKYGFKLSNRNVCNNPKQKILQEMMHTNLDEIADALTNMGNCINEIMREIYNVKEL